MCRYVLTENKMALPKFLLSVDWSSESEVAELPILLDLWKVRFNHCTRGAIAMSHIFVLLAQYT